MTLTCIDQQISENFDLKVYQIDSGSGSRIRPRDGGADSAAFSERKFSNRVLLFLLFKKSALKLARTKHPYLN